MAKTERTRKRRKVISKLFENYGWIWIEERN